MKINIFNFSIPLLMIILLVNTVGLILLYTTPIFYLLALSFLYYESCLLEEGFNKDALVMKGVK
jgi:hypothetical protein